MGREAVSAASVGYFSITTCLPMLPASAESSLIPMCSPSSFMPKPYTSAGVCFKEQIYQVLSCTSESGTTTNEPAPCCWCKVLKKWSTSAQQFSRQLLNIGFAGREQGWITDC
jgi:hypothetical protein